MKSVSALYDEFADSYSKARKFVKRGCPSEAREQIMACIAVLDELYHLKSASIKDRAVYSSHTRKFQKLADTLLDYGITDEILDAMNLKKEVKTSLRISDDESKRSPDWCAELFAKYKDSVAEITATSKRQSFSGTGFVISSNGYLLTNDHVIYDRKNGIYCSRISMHRSGDCQNRIELDIVDTDKTRDIALCRFNPLQAGKISAISRISDYSKINQGTEIMVIGNPLSMGLAPVRGEIRYACNQEGNLVYNILCNFGDSGGPILLKTGECIGIHKSFIKSMIRGADVIDVQGMANGTPMNEIDLFLSKCCDKYEIIL